MKHSPPAKLRDIEGSETCSEEVTCFLKDCDRQGEIRTSTKVGGGSTKGLRGQYPGGVRLQTRCFLCLGYWLW